MVSGSRHEGSGGRLFQKNRPMRKTLPSLFVFAATSSLVAEAATLAAGDGSDLTGTLFVDLVATGGNDLQWDNGNGSSHAWEIPSGGSWASDGSQTVSLTGIAIPIWANSTPDDTTNNTQNGTLTFTFYSLGADGDVGAGYSGDTLIGTATAAFNSSGDGVGTYFVNFDTPVVWAAADSTAFSVSVSSDAALRLKTGPVATGVEAENTGNGNTRTGYLMSLSVAGTVAPVPEPSVALLGSLALFGLLRRRR